MKRRHAVLLGLVFLLLAGGYVAWCWRPFYLPPKVTYHIDYLRVPQAKDLVEKWRAANAGWDDMPFGRRPALIMLMRPWDDYRGNSVAFVDRLSADRIVCRIVAPHAGRVALLGWVRRDGKWEMESESKW